MTIFFVVYHAVIYSKKINKSLKHKEETSSKEDLYNQLSAIFNDYFYSESQNERFSQNDSYSVQTVLHFISKSCKYHTKKFQPKILMFDPPEVFAIL